MKGHSYYPVIFTLGLLSFAQVCRDGERLQCTEFWRNTRSTGAIRITRSTGRTGRRRGGGLLDAILGKLNGQKGAQQETITKTMKQTITVGAAPTEAAGKNGTDAAAGGVKTVIQTITSGSAQDTKPAAAATVTVTITAAADAKTVTQMMTMTQVQTITMVQMIACGTTQGNPVPASQASAIASSAADAASSNANKQPPAASTTASSSASSAATSAATSASSSAASLASSAATSTSAAQTSSTKAAQTTPAAAQPPPPPPPTTTAAAPSPPPTTAQPAKAASSLVLPVAGGGAQVAAPVVSTMDPAGLQGVNNMPINLSGLTLNSNLNLGAIAAQKTPAALGAAAAAAPAATTSSAEPFKLVLSN
ncbi:hypothetical protein PG994_007403 [Apiospora phragmitis]|uniref:Uncharacterized protein n=1 Tax=Apiospora phragmitis TaxID=2905665 RepID=A0ABR1V0P6_9PEZI